MTNIETYIHVILMKTTKLPVHGANDEQRKLPPSQSNHTLKQSTVASSNGFPSLASQVFNELL
ncbi:hypothetical protein SESBI_33637 [Sesbania bispinosa]|nr:hypothetical protein SESBI_33637 [Sesbania bispinosa]